MIQRAQILILAALPVSFMLLAGCARHEGLGPTSGAIVPLDHPNQASVEEQGIRIFVDGDAWRGEPRDLERQMTALWVRIENHGGLPMRLMYQDFKLESGKQILAPLPPFVSGSGANRSRHRLWQTSLPSSEMIRQALLEGFLVAGGSVSGFLYFPRLPADTAGDITFWASMPSAADETSFVNMKIGLRPR
jgi:hypothetical protein